MHHEPFFFGFKSCIIGVVHLSALREKRISNLIETFTVKEYNIFGPKEGIS